MVSLRLKSWGFASMLRLANKNGTWNLALGTPNELALSITFTNFPHAICPPSLNGIINVVVMLILTCDIGTN